MTDLTRPVSRVTGSKVFEAGKWRSVIVTLEPPQVLKFRPKGCRKSYSLTTGVCYILAAKAATLAQERSKRTSRPNPRPKPNRAISTAGRLRA